MEPDRRIVVLKFGGTSLSTTADLERAARHVARCRAEGHAAVVVVSARADLTDRLIAEAAEAGGVEQAGTSHYLRELDQLMATGECQSAAIMALTLQRMGIPAVSLTGGQAGVATAGHHGTAVVDVVNPTPIHEHLNHGRVVVVTGFQGVGNDGAVRTLGRGGSDTTAVALAVAVRARRCEIYTDVDGIYTADPRITNRAVVLEHIDATAMSEMAFAGARVLHARAVELACANDLELVVRHTGDHGAGTLVTCGEEQLMYETSTMARGIVHDESAVLVTVASSIDPTREVVDALANRGIPLDLLGRTCASTTGGGTQVEFTVSHDVMPQVRDVLETLGSETTWTVEEGLVTVALVGHGLLSRPTYASRFLSTLDAHSIPLRTLAMNQARISAVIPSSSLRAAVDALHDEFLAAADQLVRTPA